jgi:hypothetical protein
MPIRTPSISPGPEYPGAPFFPSVADLVAWMNADQSPRRPVKILDLGNYDEREVYKNLHGHIKRLPTTRTHLTGSYFLVPCGAHLGADLLRIEDGEEQVIARIGVSR